MRGRGRLPKAETVVMLGGDDNALAARGGKHFAPLIGVEVGRCEPGRILIARAPLFFGVSVHAVMYEVVIFKLHIVELTLAGHDGNKPFHLAVVFGIAVVIRAESARKTFVRIGKGASRHNAEHDRKQQESRDRGDDSFLFHISLTFFDRFYYTLSVRQNQGIKSNSPFRR